MRPQFLILCLLGLLLTPPASAQDVDGVNNYAYGVFIGTGKYRISDRTIYIFRLPFTFGLQEADYETGQIGYRLLVPYAIGFTNYDSFEDVPDLTIDDVQTMSVTPGIEVIFPLKANWQIKPFGQAGLGWDTKSSNNSFVWGAGARTRAWFGDNEKWLVGGEFLWAGNHPKYDGEPDTSFTRWGIGAEYKLQTSWAPLGHRVSVHGRLLQWYYSNAVNFEPPREPTNLNRATEIGLSFGIDPPINIFGYQFQQGGIGYERADEVKAIKLFTTFPF